MIYYYIIISIRNKSKLSCNLFRFQRPWAFGTQTTICFTQRSDGTQTRLASEPRDSQSPSAAHTMTAQWKFTTRWLKNAVWTVRLRKSDSARLINTDEILQPKSEIFKNYQFVKFPSSYSTELIFCQPKP